MTDSAAAGTGTAGDPPPAPSRAGRNLPAAIATGVGLGAVILVSLFTWKWLFGVVVGAALAVGVWELHAAFLHRGIRIARTPLYASLAVMLVATALWGLEAELVVLGATVVAILMWRLRRGTDGYVADVTASAFVAVYLPFMAGFVMLMLAADDGPQRIVAFILLTIGNDIGGYATGVLFGKHPIAPQISPKKSWEGFAGSLLVQCVIGVVLFVVMFDAPWWQGLITGAVMTVIATAGDFAESALKRDLGVKDMGSVLPGHGGIMDRLDSLIPNAFVAWALFTLFLGPGT